MKRWEEDERDARKALEQVERATTSVENEIDNLHERFQEFEAEVARLEGVVAEKDAEIERMQERFADLVSRMPAGAALSQVEG